MSRKNSPELKFRITVNGKEIDNTFTAFKREYLKARKAVKDNPIGSEAWKEAAKNLGAYKKLMDDAEAAQKDFIDDLKSDEEVLKEFSASFAQLFSGLKRGDYNDIKSGINGIAGSIKNVGKATLSLLANPIGLFIATLATIGLATKEWVKYNQEAVKTTRLTQNITGLVGEQSHAVRLHAETISTVFDQDYKQTLETANVLVKKFGISWTEALDTIQDGLIEGGVANDEFLESLNEYAPFLADAGYSIGEFKNIIATGYDLGVFKDKLPDALKEFHLSMNEQTKATQEALDNAFGVAFTDKLFKGVKDGSVTTKKALQLIIKESKKYGLSIQQQQQLTADLFRGAGEDAGGALKIFEAINQSLEQQAKVLTPLQQILQETTEAHHDLAVAKDEALRSDDYVVFAGELDIIWTKIQTVFYNALSGIRSGFTNWTKFLTKQMVINSVTLQTFPIIVKNNFKKVIFSFQELGKSVLGFGGVIEKVLNLDFKGAKKAATAYKENIVENFKAAKGSATGIVDELVRIRKEAAKKVDLKFAEREQAFIDQAKLEATQKAEEEAFKSREHLTRKQLEDIRKRLEKEKEYRDEVLLGAKDLITQEEAAHQERLKKAGLYKVNRSKLTSDQLKALEILELTHQTNIARIENEAISAHLEKQKHAFEKEQQQRLIVYNNELASITSLEEAKALLADTLSDEELAKIKTLKDAKSEIQRSFERKELDHQALFYKKQIELMQSIMEGEGAEGINLADAMLTDEQKELLTQRMEEVRLKLSELKVKKSDQDEQQPDEGLDVDFDIFGFTPGQWEEVFSNLDNAKGRVQAIGQVLEGLQNAWGMYNQFVSAAEQRQLQSFEKSSKRKKDALQKQLDNGIIDRETYSKRVEAIDQDLAKKKAEIEHKQAKREKDMAVANVAIQTASAIMSIWAQVPKFDFGVSAGLMTAFVSALGAAKIGLILSQPLPEKNSYAKGGFTKGLGYYDETGEEVAGTVHADEYVIPRFVMNSTDPAIPQIVQYVENKRQMKLGKFAEGGFTSNPDPSFTNSTATTDTSSAEGDSTMLLLADAIHRMVDEGVEAFTFIGDQEILDFQQRYKKLKQSRDNAKRS